MVDTRFNSAPTHWWGIGVGVSLGWCGKVSMGVRVPTRRGTRRRGRRDRHR